jgi:hypothetical protein
MDAKIIKNFRERSVPAGICNPRYARDQPKTILWFGKADATNIALIRRSSAQKYGDHLVEGDSDKTSGFSARFWCFSNRSSTSDKPRQAALSLSRLTAFRENG